MKQLEFENPLPASVRICTVLVSSIALAVPVAPADSVNTLQRSTEEPSSGVYAIRHADAPDGFPQGNTTVIVGEHAVLVVDSCYLPSSARDDIAQIRSWTQRPVRYLVNTHWHPDHQRGNAEYAAAFPFLTIVAQHQTGRLQAGYDGQNLIRYPRLRLRLEQTLETGLHPDGSAVGDAEREEMQRQLDGSALVFTELDGLRPRLPDLTFERALDIDLGGRSVQVRHSGPGDTLGDAWVYLPQEKILITGDVLTHPVPYFFAGYPASLLSTLEGLAAMDVELIVPGHGPILRGKDYLRSVIALIDTVVREVNRQVELRGSLSARLEDVKQSVDVSRFREEFTGDDRDSAEFFDQSVAALIRNAFHQAPK